MPGVITPAQRLARLRKLSEEASWRKRAEREQIGEDLAAAIGSEDDSLIRAEIVRTLGKYPGPAAERVLRVAVRDPDLGVRVAACEVWGKRGGPEATTVLSGLLGGDVEPEVRWAAAKALGQTKDPAALAVLGEALDSADPAMQHRAVLSLREVTGKDFGTDVNQWRQFVKGEPPKPAKPVSIAERIWDWF